ncbi:MAG: YkvA family protein [Brevinema sp.]
MQFTEETLKKQLNRFKSSSLSEEQFKKAKELAIHLKEEMQNLLVIIDMVRDTLKGRYKLDLGTLSMLVAVVVYVISPLDLIPDPTPLIGWLDDIGVIGFAMRQYAPAISQYLSVHKSISKAVDQVTHNLIEEKVIVELTKINNTISKQYQSLGRELSIEICFFVGIIALKHFYPPTPAKSIILGFIILRSLISISRSTYTLHKILKEIHFYKVSHFFSYWKLTKNFHDALKMDAKNFYDYHYQALLHPSAQLAHRFTAFIQLTPSDEEIFDRIYLSLSKNIPIIMKKKFIRFVMFFTLYFIFVFVLRQLAQYAT